MEKKNLKLVFASPVVVNDKNRSYTYKLYYSDNPDVVWGNYWDYDNPSLVDDEDIFPQESVISDTQIINSDYKLGLARENACYPLLYCTYGILALAWIDIEGLENYPEQGRGVLKFGMDYEEVQKIIEQYKKMA